MALMNRLKEIFSRTPSFDPKQIKDKLPFVHLFGFEKSYGAPHPQDYDAMLNAYKSWVYACAWKNATSVAAQKLCLYKRTYVEEEEKLDIIARHPFLDVINGVNPFSNRFELFTITQLFLELTGNAYWWIPRNNFGVPYMIWNIPSNWMKVVPSKEKFIEGYVMKVPNIGQFIPFDEDEIIHFKFPSPLNLYYGLGPTFAAQFGASLNEQIKTWGINYFLNNAQPGGILTTEQGLSEQQYIRLRDEWNRKHKGVKNSGKMAFLEGGLKYQQIGSTVREARMDDINPEVRSEILAMFGVPASKLGLESHDNRATAEASDYTYQKETIFPRLRLIEEKLNEKFIPNYTQDQGIEILTRFDNAIPEDKEYRLKEKQINIASGFSTIDEEREREGLDPFNLPETSKPLISFGLMPAGEERPKTDSFGKPVEEEKEEKSIKSDSLKDAKWRAFANMARPQEKAFAFVLSRYFESQHGEVMRKLSNYKKFDDAVNKDLTGFIIFNYKEQVEKLKNLSKGYVQQAYITGLTLGMADTNSSIDFDLFEPNILRAVEKRVTFFSGKINESTVGLISEALQDNLKNGGTIQDLTSKIDKIFNYSKDFRSKTIAQTEVNGSINEGLLKSYSEAGVKTKEWISQRDGLVRHSHKGLDNGKAIDLLQPWTTELGSVLLYPGDSSAGADLRDIINCRCRLDVGTRK